jgi:iron complex outermembrane receptor protein
VGGQAARPVLADSVVVLGKAEPGTLRESSRATAELDVAGQAGAVGQMTDVLRTDSSVDVQQRGAGGVQSDVAIRGANYEQTLVLLNGFRINDAQTSHFNLDVPVPLEGIAGLDTLHGAGSTVYGSDAVGGVVNVRTLPAPTTDWARLRAGGGSFGMNSESAVLGGERGRVSEVLGGGRDFSTGFIADRDYRSEEASSETRLRTGLGETDALLAGSDRAYGAAGFYGNYPSFERTKGWYGLLRQELGERTAAMLGYRRHTDRFVLFRQNPGLYTNQHADESWQARVDRRDRMGTRWRVDSGLEEDLDAIHSNNLGQHGRNRGAGYAQAEWRTGPSTGHSATVSAGGRLEVLSGGGTVWSPAVSGSWVAGRGVKLRGAMGRGFRQPTYTDLYYSDPTQQGNAGLRPESAWNYEVGTDWFVGSRWVVSATGFVSPQHGTIDYVRAVGAQRYQAENLSNFRYAGFETNALWRMERRGSVRAAWTYVSGARDVLQGLESRYVFNYARHNASVEWLANGPAGLTARTRMGVVQRFQREPYAVLDVGVFRGRGMVQPFAQMTNLANTGYQEIAGVPMPGRGFVGGVVLMLGHGR